MPKGTVPGKNYTKHWIDPTREANLKQSLYRPGQALTSQGGWGSHNF